MTEPLRFRFDRPAHQLRAARKRLGLSQAEVAGKMGVTQAHVSKIEAGMDSKASTLANMARVLGYEIMLVPIRLVPAVNALVRSHDGQDPAPAPRYRPDDDDDDDEDEDGGDGGGS